MQLTHEKNPFEAKKFPILLVGDRIEFLQNIGSLFRIAEAFGVEKLLFLGTQTELNYRQINKTSRNTHLHLPYEKMMDETEAIAYLMQNQYEIIALEIAETSIPLAKVKIPNNQKIALIVGNEINGISESILNVAHQIVHINMYGVNSSMNVVQATSIALYELTNKLKDI